MERGLGDKPTFRNNISKELRVRIILVALINARKLESMRRAFTLRFLFLSHTDIKHVDVPFNPTAF